LLSAFCEQEQPREAVVTRRRL